MYYQEGVQKLWRSPSLVTVVTWEHKEVVKMMTERVSENKEGFTQGAAKLHTELSNAYDKVNGYVINLE